MIKKLYSLYDVKSEFYGAPVAFHNDEDAMRGVASVFNNPGSMFAAHPEDYKLYYLAHYNDNSGVIDTSIPVKYICDLASLNPHPDMEGGDN